MIRLGLRNGYYLPPCLWHALEKIDEGEKNDEFQIKIFTFSDFRVFDFVLFETYFRQNMLVRYRRKIMFLMFCKVRCRDKKGDEF